MRWIRNVLIVLLALAAITWWLFTRTISLGTHDGSVFIPPNTSVAAAVDSVHAKCTLYSPWLVKTAARIVARLSDRPLQAGWYKFDASNTQFDVLRSLFTGDRRPTVRVTIPEGSTYKNIASILQRTVQCDSAAFVAWCEDDSVCQRFGVDNATMEGYLKPDTYDFFWRHNEARIGDKLARAFIAMWMNNCEARLQTSGFTRHEIVTLASIVQAEGISTEMPRIAGVYTNRLARRMKLAADPTVQYGLDIKRRLTYADLAKDNAYNTYLHVGLPPGPINCPGLYALRAALEPESHSYLFFVARGDESGLHNFARTDTEHAVNVRRYRATRD